MFNRLDFVYLPSRDVAADIEHWTKTLGGELVFAIERFGTRVASVRLGDGPALLLAEHLEGDQPVLLFRVDDLDAATVPLGARFEFPYGEGAEVDTPGPQRIAIYERSRPDRGDSLNGRRDF